MEFISGLATVLLTTVGYASGAALAGKDKSPAPKLLDLCAVSILWVFAFVSQPTLGRWVAVAVWFTVGGAVAFALTAARGGQPSAKAHRTAQPDTDRGFLQRIWHAWKRFALRLGNYQGRLILTFFYFLVVTPFGVLVRLFSDPLEIKYKTAPSFWANRPEDSPDLNEARRQF